MRPLADEDVFAARRSEFQMALIVRHTSTDRRLSARFDRVTDNALHTGCPFSSSARSARRYEAISMSIVARLYRKYFALNVKQC